jgi:hypothetical protein
MDHSFLRHGDRFAGDPLIAFGLAVGPSAEFIAGEALGHAVPPDDGIVT